MREVVAVDIVPDFLEEGRKRASADAANVEFVEGDAMALPFGEAEFDLAGSLKTLHHLPRPELAVAELARVTRPGGLLLVVDQVAPIDPIAAVELDRFERARDPSHTRVLPDTDFRGLFDANDLVLRRAEFESQRREVEPYLDLAGCEGGARNRARALAGGASYEVDDRLVPARQASRHLIEHPTGGVSLVAGSRPSSTASIASRKYCSETLSSSRESSIAPWYTSRRSASKRNTSGVRSGP